MNVFVIFAPGLGGNHLANMISTDPRFHTRTYLNDYLESNRTDAHFSSFKNLGNLDELEQTDNNVLCGHFGQLLWINLNIYKPIQAVIVKLPEDKQHFAYKRFIDKATLNDYFVEEQRSLYDGILIEKITGIHDLHYVRAEDIFSATAPVKLLQEMNYQIDTEMCSIMHNCWLEKISQNIK